MGFSQLIPKEALPAMTASSFSTLSPMWVAIDIAKTHHVVLVEHPDGRRRHFRIANTQEDFTKLSAFLSHSEGSCRIAFEPTGDYHRPLAHFLQAQGFTLALAFSVAVARTREALYNSWDKNDPKDAQVILHLLKTGATQLYHDPLLHGHHDLQELAGTYHQVSLHKVRLRHSLRTHYLPLYFPEAERYLHSTRAEWFTQLLILVPCPAAVLKYSPEQFIEAARRLDAHKNDKIRWLADFYPTARTSIGLPVREDSEAIRMFRVVLQEYLHRCRLRRELEEHAMVRLADHPDFRRLQTIPGIGPILALFIMAEAGDLRRFHHHRQFLKYCGLDLSTEQSGQFRGITKLSKRGNARLRYAFWVAGTVAVRAKQNSFSRKFYQYIRHDPADPDLRRKAYTAIAAKMARVAYAIVKAGTDYRRFPEATMPGGRIPSARAVEAIPTS
jgi:transposase